MQGRIVALGAIVYVVVVAAVVFGPAPDGPLRSTDDSLRSAKVDLRSVAPGRQSPAEHSRPQRPLGKRSIIAGATTEELGNVAMFVPLGALVAVLWPRRRWFAVPMGVAASSAIELIQVALPWRSASLNDIRWNSIGAAVGLAAVMVTVVAARRIRGHREGARRADAG